MDGDKAMKELLARVASDKGARKQLRKAVLEYGNEVMLPRLVTNTPRLTGALQRSEKVKVRISAKKEDVGITIIAGGASAPYAPTMHETAKRKPKFMERTLRDCAPTALGDIAGRVDLKAAGKGA